MGNVNIAVIGAGRMGQLHANNFAKKTNKSKVIAVADQNKKLAKQLSQEIGAKMYTNIQDILDIDAVDAVCIATPVSTHKKIIIKALKANKHVFCEKPLTLKVDDAYEIMKAVKDSKCYFQLGFMRRFDEDFMAAKEKLQEGIIGTPVFIRSSGRDPGLPPVPGWGSRPKECGDISFELCSHDYDSMRWLLNDDIKKVFAQAAILSSKDVAVKCDGTMINDSIVVSLEFNRGAFGSIDGLLNIKYGYDARVEIVGEEGIIIIGGINYKNIIYGGKDKLLKFPSAPSFVDRFKHAYDEEAQHFIDCIVKGEFPKVGAEDGLHAVKVASAVNRSIELKQPVLIEEN